MTPHYTLSPRAQSDLDEIWDSEMTGICKLHEAWMNDPQHQAEYEALEYEFSLSPVMIKAPMPDLLRKSWPGV